MSEKVNPKVTYDALKDTEMQRNQEDETSVRKK